MANLNLQVRIPPEVDSQISELSPKSKSAFVREAVEEKIRREKDRQREEKWIQALKRHPEDRREGERWLKAESWDSQ